MRLLVLTTIAKLIVTLGSLKGSGASLTSIACVVAFLEEALIGPVSAYMVVVRLAAHIPGRRCAI